MSSSTNVLFDIPGPRARAQNRVLGLVSGLVILALFAAVLWGLRGQITPAKWVPFLRPETWTNYFLPGFLGTVQAAGLAVVLAGVLGIILGAGRLSHVKPISVLAGTIVEFFRAVPVLVMMVFSYYGYLYSGILTGHLLTLGAVVTGLTFYNASVIAELIRAGVHSLPKGQREAGLAIGLNHTQTLATVLLPQAIAAMLPSLVSQLVIVLKDSALGYMVSYSELLRAGQTLAAVEGNLIVTFIVVGVMFVVINHALTVLARWLERKLAKRTSGHLSVEDETALQEA